MEIRTIMSQAGHPGYALPAAYRSPIYKLRTDNYESFRRVLGEFCKETGCHRDYLVNLLYTTFEVECFDYSDDWKWGIVLGYFEKTVIPHKNAVWKSGLQLLENEYVSKIVLGARLPIFLDNLLIHDLSKFSAVEALGYAFHDFSKKEYDPYFASAWHHHKQHNMHHPEYWMSTDRGGNVTLMDMPVVYVVEMIADWMGASLIYSGTDDLRPWLKGNLGKFCFAENTRRFVRELLCNIYPDLQIWDNPVLNQLTID